jgi:uncharacterized protein
MKISLTTLEEGSREFTFLVKPEAFNEKHTVQDKPLEYQLSGPVDVQVKVHRYQDQVTVTGRFETKVTTTCSRCLETARCEVSGDLVIDYRPGQVERPEEVNAAPASVKRPPADVELQDEELDVVRYHGTELDLTEEVRQAIILNLPMQPLCRQDCQGLCVGCGENLNLKPCQCPNEKDSNPFTQLKDLIK